MLEQIVAFLGSVDAVWIYVLLFFFSFIENIFPPSPSDVVVVVGASLISHSTIGFLPILFITSLGSSLGFMLVYVIGLRLGERILDQGKIRFIKRTDLDRAELWFRKHGYSLILANRFLPGTRSIISFFSGVSQLNAPKTFVAASASAFAWNWLIILLGRTLGNNVARIDRYLSAYSRLILLVTLLLAALFAARLFWRKKSGH